jgi:hypothetical protein
MEAAIVAAIAGFLPALLNQVSERAGESIAGELTSGAGKLAKQLWDRLHGAVLGDPAAKAMAEKVATNPHDQRAQDALAYQLEDVLARDAALRADLAAILDAAGDVTAATGGTAIKQTASGSGVNVGGANYGTIRTNRDSNRDAS